MTDRGGRESGRQGGMQGGRDARMHVCGMWARAHARAPTGCVHCVHCVHRVHCCCVRARYLLVEGASACVCVSVRARLRACAMCAMCALGVHGMCVRARDLLVEGVVCHVAHEFADVVHHSIPLASFSPVHVNECLGHVDRHTYHLFNKQKCK
jgi:hypothetical protein